LFVWDVNRKILAGSSRALGMDKGCGLGEVGRTKRLRQPLDQRINGRIIRTLLGFWGSYGGLQFLEGLEFLLGLGGFALFAVEGGQGEMGLRG
jgi:hypothetical protein